jgi:trans-aconitate 2-methyltransferase
MTWDPALYLEYGDDRTRPVADLLAHVPDIDPTVVFDLGCGPGNSTALLAERWPACRLAGIDSDPAMLTRARRGGVAAQWIAADLQTWRPDTPPDLVFSNAALHWLDDHPTLFPRLLGDLRPGGVLAVQMPNNFDAPSHVLMRRTALDGPWSGRLAPLLRAEPVASPQAYHRWLRAEAAQLTIWETTYLLRLTGADPVLSWMRGAALRPLIEALEDRQAAAFEAAYADRLRAAYPRESDGATLFPFRRLFILATRRG